MNEYQQRITVALDIPSPPPPLTATTQQQRHHGKHSYENVPQLHPPLPSSATPSFTDDDSTYSATGTATATTTAISVTGIPSDVLHQATATQQNHHRRNSSLSSIPEIVIDPTDAATTFLDSSNSNMNHFTLSSSSGPPSGQPPPPPPPHHHHHHHHQSSSFGENLPSGLDMNENYTTTATTPTITITDTNKIGQLIVRRRNDSDPCPSNVQYITYLNFRPLAIQICAFDTLRNSDEVVHDRIPVLIWIGSADQNQLYCYIIDKQQQINSTPTVDDTTNQALNSICVDTHEAFTVLSPVMGIQHITWKESMTSVQKQCLVIACQDGTVRIVVFDIVIDDNGLSFQNVQYNQVIIDGPIVAVHAKRKVSLTTNISSIIHVTIGSLCGYVAELYMNPITMEFQPNEGPSMVVQGFWNCRWHVEDSVMAIYRCRMYDYVYVGTQAGRCYIYQKLNVSTKSSSITNNLIADGNNLSQLEIDELLNETMYRMIWSCQLPYSIHTIMILPDRSLLVTTRRSVHLFRQRFYTSGTNPALIVIAANRIKNCISLLQKQYDDKKKAQEVLRQRKEGELSLNKESPILSDQTLYSVPNTEHQYATMAVTNNDQQSEDQSSLINTELRQSIAIIEEKVLFETKETTVVSELVDLI